MKRIVFLLCLALLLAGCGANPEETTVTVPTSEETLVTEATEAPEVPLSQEMAMLQGYVVMEDGDVRHNTGSWMAFLEQSGTGEPCNVTVVQFQSVSGYVRYDLSFDGSAYTLSFEKDGEIVTTVSHELVAEKGLCDDTMEPYDTYEAYLLNDIVLYKDLIAEPDYEGVTEIFLHAKEGEPPVKSYAGEEAGPVLQLLMAAEYVPCEPENYVYGMKLLMTNRDGKELVIELDLNHGVYRYGMQSYVYGEVEDMLSALGLEQWPDSVLEEFSYFIK